jgi:methionyl-tRNA synthetase
MNDLEKKSVYITTSIPYVNSRPHVGHALEFVLTDAVARLYRKQGVHVFLQTGTDENAFKNVVAAQAAGVETIKFVDRNAEAFRNLVSALDIQADSFIRTTDVRHKKGVEEFWKRLNPDDLFEKSYSGLYCVGCEDFYRTEDLVNGECPDHRRPPDLIEETNIFFRLSKYQDELLRKIESGELRVLPESRRNEVSQFIRSGLQDISITRAKVRAGDWGIAVPGTNNQVIYVWIDALINYLSGIGFGQGDDWKKFWRPETKKIHVIGKNVWKFHAVYWPALLLSAGLPLPNEILVHGFLTTEGEKISKSLGNSVDPSELIKRYGSDALRHLLLHRLALYQDADFSLDKLHASYHGDLANRLGNLYSRLLALAEKSAFNFAVSFDDRVVSANQYGTDTYEINKVSEVAWLEIDRLNAEINDQKPWTLLKGNSHEELHVLLKNWFTRLRDTLFLLEAFIPNGVGKVKKDLSRGVAESKILYAKIDR